MDEPGGLPAGRQQHAQVDRVKGKGLAWKQEEGKPKSESKKSKNEEEEETHPDTVVAHLAEEGK